MPGHPGARLDGVRAAIATLAGEEQRFMRLGLDDALRRVRRERRYWEFLEALFSLPPHGAHDVPAAFARWPREVGS
jgi:hypothetical protein